LPSVTEPFHRIAVVGLGLIGGSLLQGLAHGGHSVVGTDVDPATIAAAVHFGAEVAGDTASAVRGADLVVLAVPLPDLPTALRHVAPHLEPHAVLTDVGTLKSPVHALVRELAPGARFIGGHPLAGTEHSGWDAADPLMFRDAPWALTLESEADLDPWLRLASLICNLGARPVPTRAAEQDIAVARVIGLPHVLAEVLALAGLAGGALGLSLAAGSYTSGSRVARTRPELVATWCDGNPGLVRALDDVIERLSTTRAQLSRGGSVLPLAQAGYDARIGWEQRGFEPVELPARAADLLAHGASGGWITAVLIGSSGAARLLGMRPTA
jgi:prephenate dehydrogenase